MAMNEGTISQSQSQKRLQKTTQITSGYILLHDDIHSRTASLTSEKVNRDASLFSTDASG